jgi:RimJ/RimL family protein N-acetyltransferase
MPCDPVRTVEDMRRWVQQALEDGATRKRIPFTIFLRAEEEVAGSTSIFDIRTHDRALEIGWTWLGNKYQRTPVNTECKYLLLKHAFEELKAIRVQLKTDSRNELSQRALQRLGAVREGVLRRHMVVAGGHVRDTVMYSVVDGDWPNVKAHLEDLLHRQPSSPA